jgi:hypothetical protein
MVVRAADAGWRVAERDVPYLPRAGKSKVTGTWRGTWHAVRDMRGVLTAPAGSPGATAPAPQGAPTSQPAPTPQGAPQAVSGADPEVGR